MASGVTEVADIIVPEIFGPYVQQLTEQKSRLVQGGVLVPDAAMNADMTGGGLTFNTPSFTDLDDDDDNVSSDTGADSDTAKIGTGQEVSVRLSRNKSWASADLAAALAGEDPMGAIAERVSSYWVRRMQSAFIATVQGVFADNAKAPDSGDPHTQNDLTNDISGASYSAGVTDFNSSAFIDTESLMGDSADALGILMVHSMVMARLKKNNLIDYIPDARGEVKIPMYQGKIVLVDDGMPNPAGAGAAQTDAGIYHTWVFAAGSFRLGVGSPKVPVAVTREELANNGGGEEILTNRHEWAIHPVGHAYIGGTTAKGGPSNAATSGNLAHEDSWKRAFNENKQIKIRRLITRES